MKTDVGEVLRFKTKAEWDAFVAGFTLGDRYQRCQDWGDYREGDTVRVEFDDKKRTATEIVASEDCDAADEWEEGSK